MRGISKKPWPYVLKRDRALDKKEQTIWWLTVQKTVDSAEIVTRMMESRKLEENGFETWDAAKYAHVELSQFLNVVDHVDNYHMSEDDKKFHAEGFRNYVTEKERQAVYVDIPMEVCTELLKAASNADNVSEIEKAK